MKRSMEFELAWQGLKLGEHLLHYQIGKDFLIERGTSLPEDVIDIEAGINLKFDKHENFFALHFDIDGFIITPCDRCGDEFKMQLWDEFDLIIKLTDMEQDEQIDEDADIAFIPKSETVLDISKWLYEFLILSIPLQRVHPLGTDGESTCNPEVLKLLGKFAEPTTKNKNDIWKGLDTLQNNKNNNKHKN